MSSIRSRLSVPVLIALLAASQAIPGAASAEPAFNPRIETPRAIQDIRVDRVRSLLGSHSIVVVAGFQGVDEQGNITTLGRGGSDTTAVALAAALKADECHIYTDVDGVYTADPRIVTGAQKLSDPAWAGLIKQGKDALYAAAINGSFLQDAAIRAGQRGNSNPEMIDILRGHSEAELDAACDYASRLTRD